MCEECDKLKLKIVVLESEIDELKERVIALSELKGLYEGRSAALTVQVSNQIMVIGTLTDTIQEITKKV